jgi:hypothetical protein
MHSEIYDTARVLTCEELKVHAVHQGWHEVSVATSLSIHFPGQSFI